MPVARPMMLASASGELNTRVAAERPLQAVRDLEDAALAGHGRQRARSAAVGHVLAEDDDARVARHLVLERAIDRRDHRVGPAVRRRASGKRVGGRIDVRRIDVKRDRVGRRLGRLHRPFGRVVDLAVDLVTNGGELLFGGEPFGLEKLGEPDDRIARRFRRTLVRRLVQLLVVRQRMRVRADDLGVHERRTLAARARRRSRPTSRDSSPGSRCRRCSAPESGEGRDELRDVAAGGLHFDRHRDRVAVVLDDVDDGQVAEAGGVERLPELAFARRAVADRDVGDLVAVEPRLAPFDGGDPLVEERGLRAADGLEALRAGRARLRHDVQLLVSPVRRHLPAARRGVVLRADRRQQHLVGRHADRQAERAIAIVGIEPVVCRLELHAGGDEDRLVAGAADLEEDQALVLELDFLVVDPPGEDHRPIGSEEILAGEPVGVEWAGRVAL